MVWTKPAPLPPPVLRQGPIRPPQTQHMAEPDLASRPWRPSGLAPSPGRASGDGSRRGAAHRSSSSPTSFGRGRKNAGKNQLYPAEEGSACTSKGQRVRHLPGAVGWVAGGSCPPPHPQSPAPPAGPAPQWGWGRRSAGCQGCSTARRAQHPPPQHRRAGSTPKDGDTHPTVLQMWHLLLQAKLGQSPSMTQLWTQRAPTPAEDKLAKGGPEPARSRGNSRWG